MKRIIALMIVMLVLLSACATPTSLVDTKWQLANLDGKPALAGVTVTLNFGKDAIGGIDGCNSYGGSYTAGESEIKFHDDIFHTEMFCTDEIAAQSTAYYAVVKQTSVYQVDSQLLALFNADGKKLAEFIPVKE